ncbi:MarR family transcriptional regulator [Pseudoclavibacter endophyticus]|uniref:Winged helix-turn-helix transcriptional regulator n=1 Tax=Pseudoclavibacter endophyticus TaxID=1778590 RepID=A0A6H9WFH0_9MICO|nr:MarR family winged helix-turn-helix transcriptional regulator [Pseudoclavibacter endophyticus]KAB1649709.1 winged helix-turn-helix transcriptional regulator [Pseudoclavibacter endophyticus]GGA60384.1 MarR family transcriptional regulator [Pseudoclavibacter endophyticus]
MTRATPPSGLDSAQLEVWAAVATLLERLPAALDAQLQRDSDLTRFEHGLLFALGTAPDRALRMSTLAGYANCTLSRVSRAVTRLEKKGLVRREVDPADGRVSLAVLTDDGGDMLLQSTPAHHALVERLVFEPLNEAQVRQLGAISRAINEAIDPAETWTVPSSGADGS